MSDTKLPGDPAPEYIMSRDELQRHLEARRTVVRELAVLLGLTLEQQRKANETIIRQWYFRMSKIVHENDMRVATERHEKVMREAKARMEAAGINTEGL